MKDFISAGAGKMRMVLARMQDVIGLPPASIEKDLWVTQVLHALFFIASERAPDFQGRHFAVEGLGAD